MPHVRMTDDGPSVYNSRATGMVAPGDEIEVSATLAAHLIDELGYFDAVDGLASFDVVDDDEPEPDSYTCDEAGCDFATGTPQGLAAHARSHK